MPDSVLGKIAVEIGGGTAANGGGGGSPSSTSIAGGGDSETKKQLGLLGKMRDNLGTMTKNSSGEPRFWTKALKTMGIQVGLAGILKQSQVFTSTLGSLFQILGAFVDVILAPWMPLFVPLLRGLARQIPKVKKWSENVYKWATETMGPWVKNMAIKLWNWTKTAWAATKEVWKYITDEKFLQNLMTDVGKFLLDFAKTGLSDGIVMLKRLWNSIVKHFPDWMGGGEQGKGQLDAGETSWEIAARKKDEAEAAKRRAAGLGGPGSDRTEQTILGAGVGKNGNGFPKEDHLLPRDVTGFSLLDKPLNTAAEHLEDALETFANMDFAKQVGIGYGASAAARYGATPLGAALHQAPFGSAMKKPIDIGMDALKKPHQIMNFLAKNTGKGMMATFGKATGVVKPQSTASMFDDFLDEMYDPSTMKKVVNKAPQMSRLNSARNLMRTASGNAGEFIGSTTRGVTSAVSTAAKPAASKVGQGLEEAMNQGRSFMKWLASLIGNPDAGSPGFVKMVNTKLSRLWSVFSPHIATPGGAALRAIPALATRIAKYIIPGAATAFVIGEFKYDLAKMMAKNDMPWLRDPLNLESYKAEGAGIGGNELMGQASQNLLAQNQLNWFGLGGNQDKAAQDALESFRQGRAGIHRAATEGVASGTKTSMIGTRIAGGAAELIGSLFGPAGIPLALSGLIASEAARQQGEMGIQTGQDYIGSGAFMNDIKFFTNPVQKIFIDGASAESTYITGGDH